MKKILKYGLVLALLLLLSSVTKNAVQVLDASISTLHQTCSFSPCQPTSSFDQTDINYQSMSCEQGQTNFSQVPSDKTILKILYRFYQFKTEHFFYPQEALNPFIHGLTNPIEYYVYGFRKIIV